MDVAQANAQFKQALQYKPSQDAQELQRELQLTTEVKRSSYRRTRRPGTRTPIESHCELARDFYQKLANMQVILANLHKVRDVDCVATMQETLAMQPEIDRITQAMLTATTMDIELQAAVAGFRDSQTERTQLIKEISTRELATPPSAHLNSTTELVGLEPSSSASSLAEVGPQFPRSSFDEQGLPWPLPMPALSSPVTTQSIDNDIEVGLGRHT